MSEVRDLKSSEMPLSYWAFVSWLDSIPEGLTAERYSINYIFEIAFAKGRLAGLEQAQDIARDGAEYDKCFGCGQMFNKNSTFEQIGLKQHYCK
jgi:hypothetical protein